MAKRLNSESTKSDLEEVERTYGIDRLNIGEAKHDLDDSEWLLANRKIFQMKNNINNYKSITHECNVIYNILNIIKHAKSKIVITHQYYRAVWAPIVEGQN